jgi:hypothetical protein
MNHHHRIVARRHERRSTAKLAALGVILALTSLSLGCASADSDAAASDSGHVFDGEPAQISQAILNGGSPTHWDDGVVMLGFWNGSSTLWCTGQLVSARAVLTSGDCGSIPSSGNWVRAYRKPGGSWDCISNCWQQTDIDVHHDYPSADHNIAVVHFPNALTTSSGDAAYLYQDHIFVGSGDVFGFGGFALKQRSISWQQAGNHFEVSPKISEGGDSGGPAKIELFPSLRDGVVTGVIGASTSTKNRLTSVAHNVEWIVEQFPGSGCTLQMQGSLPFGVYDCW